MKKDIGGEVTGKKSDVTHSKLSRAHFVCKLISAALRMCVCVFILFHLLVSPGCTTSVTYVRSSDQLSFVVSISWVLSARSLHLYF